MTSALLQLPLSMSKREKQQRVVAIIDQLVRLGFRGHMLMPWKTPHASEAVSVTHSSALPALQIRICQAWLKSCWRVMLRGRPA